MRRPFYADVTPRQRVRLPLDRLDLLYPFQLRVLIGLLEADGRRPDLLLKANAELAKRPTE